MRQREVYCIANHKSVHMLRWVKINVLCGLKTNILSTEIPYNHTDDSCKYLLSNIPAMRFLPKLVRFVIAGMKLRTMAKQYSGVVLHVHSASGNAITAFISGLPYVVTTYGTEVYRYSTSSHMYRWMMYTILTHARCITASTPAMSEAILEIVGSKNAVSVVTFPLGYDSDIFQAVGVSQRNALRRIYRLPESAPVFCINRRVTELYRTKEMLSGFIQYLTAGGSGFLVIVCGDADEPYLLEIEHLARDGIKKGRIILVKGICPQSELAAVLQMSDFAISVPKTDQLSCSILESMACGCIAVLSELSAYRELKKYNYIHWVADFNVESLCRIYMKLENIPYHEKVIQSRENIENAVNNYSNIKTAEMVMTMYAKTGLCRNGYLDELENI